MGISIKNMQILNWYKSRLEKYGFVDATILLGRVSSSRLKTILLNKFLPSKVVCPICGWTGRKFFDYIEGKSYSYSIECPQCNSHGRHRALYLWLKNDFQISDKSGLALVCAPEQALMPLWYSASSLRICKLDIEPSRGVDILADLQELPFENDSHDIIWCHHVLEQVKDDQKALKEIYRILKPETGYFVVSSSMSNNKQTQEYGSAKLHLFGNWRFYGQDYPERLSNSGFTVEEIKYNLSPQDYEKYGINRNEKVYLCRKKI